MCFLNFNRCFCAFLLNICLFWDCDTVMTAVAIFGIYLCLFRCKYNGIWCDSHTSESLSAIKPGSIHYLHLKILVPSQEYDSCCSLVWCVLSFDFAIWLGTLRFEFSSEFRIFVILLFTKFFKTEIYFYMCFAFAPVCIVLAQMKFFICVTNHISSSPK